MGFRFSLETVLRLRRSLEDGERLRLQSLLADRAQLQTQIREISVSRATLGEKLKASLQHEPLSGSEMQFAGQRVCACDLQAARLHAAVAMVTQQIERQQSLLLRRRLDRKLLENLRERQLLSYEAETRRRAQSQLEELFLLRRAREQKSS
jgi:flagellar export protein FliJ